MRSKGALPRRRVYSSPSAWEVRGRPCTRGECLATRIRGVGCFQLDPGGRGCSQAMVPAAARLTTWTVFARFWQVKMEDIGGLEEAKRALHEMLVLPSLDPDKYRAYGARPPRGLLLYGPPGTGKTLLAKAVAGEAVRQSPHDFLLCFPCAPSLAPLALRPLPCVPCVFCVPCLDPLQLTCPISRPIFSLPPRVSQASSCNLHVFDLPSLNFTFILAFSHLPPLDISHFLPCIVSHTTSLTSRTSPPSPISHPQSLRAGGEFHPTRLNPKP